MARGGLSIQSGAASTAATGSGGAGTNASAPPRFALGPLAFAVELEALEAWLDAARPGDTFEYAHGRCAPQTAPAFRRAGELGRGGAVQLSQRREGQTFHYLATRLAPVQDAPGEAVPPARSASLPETPEERVLLQLRRAANLGMVCPTNAELARACGLKDAAAASYRVRQLVRWGWIRVEDNGPNARRIVTICQTGKRTVEGRL